MGTRPTTQLLDRAAPRFHSLAVGTVELGHEAGGSVDLLGSAPPTATTLFQIGSVTKVFTSLVLARHVVRGDLSLDQPVADLLPADWRWPTGPPITLVELATHSSGLPRLPPGMWGKLWRRDPDPYADIGPDELEIALTKTALRGRGRPRYSNFGVGLLGLALARRAGASYDALVRQEVCDPLGLGDTVVERSEAQVARSAMGHRRRGQVRTHAWRLDALAGAGALWSTLEDMRAFVRAHLAPPEDELGAAIRLALSPHLQARAGSLGLGWARLPRRRGPAAWFHNGGTAGFRSMVVVCPEAGRGAVALADSDRSVDGLGISLGAPTSRSAISPS